MNEQLVCEAGLKAILPWVNLIITLCAVYVCICIVLKIMKKVHEVLFGDGTIDEDEGIPIGKIISKISTVINNGKAGKTTKKK